MENFTRNTIENKNIEDEEMKSKIRLVKINSQFFALRYKQFTDFDASYGVVAIYENRDIPASAGQAKQKTMLFLDPRYFQQARNQKVDFLPIYELPRENCILDPFEWTISQILQFNFMNPIFEIFEKYDLENHSNNGNNFQDITEVFDAKTLEIYKKFSLSELQDMPEKFSKNSAYFIPHPKKPAYGYILHKGEIKDFNISEMECEKIFFDASITPAYFLNKFDIKNSIDDPARVCDSILSDINAYKKFAKNDAIAWMNWMQDLEKNYEKHTEKSASERLNQMKNEIHGKNFGLAFENILGNNDASVQMHGRASDAQLKDGIVLLDSGSAINDGVDNFKSDVTRVFILGSHESSKNNSKIWHAIKEAYTKTLKALIEISMAKFAKNTPVKYLDQIARKYSNFAHATGHGVGRSDVHAFPAIRGDIENAFKENMLLAIEPGVYVENIAEHMQNASSDSESQMENVDNFAHIKAFGIRLESQYIVKNSEIENNFHLECLTYIPFEYDLILHEKLSEEEKVWLSNFHKICYEELVGRMDEAFLIKKVNRFINKN